MLISVVESLDPKRETVIHSTVHPMHCQSFNRCTLLVLLQSDSSNVKFSSGSDWDALMT